MFFHKIEKIVKNYVERVENINIKVYTSGVDNMQIDHLSNVINLRKKISNSFRIDIFFLF